MTGMPPPPVDVLIPTYRRPCALAVTLASLVGQTHRLFRVEHCLRLRRIEVHESASDGHERS